MGSRKRRDRERVEVWRVRVRKRGERSFRILWDCLQEKEQGRRWLADLWRVRCSLHPDSVRQGESGPVVEALHRIASHRTCSFCVI